MQLPRFIKEYFVDNLNKPRVLKIIISLSAVAVISRTFPLFSYFYFILPFLFLLILLAGYKFVLKDNLLRNLILFFFLFAVWSAVTSFWSEHPIVTLSRSGYLILLSSGGVIAGYLWQRISPGSFIFLLYTNIVVIVLSLFSFLSNIPTESWSGGNNKGFMGFAGHQNTLASAILFTLPSVIAISLEKKRMIWFLLLFLNLVFLLFTFSRASILSLTIGVFIFLIFRKKWNTLAYSSTVLLLIFCLIWFSPSLNKEAQKFVSKDFPAFYSTREWMWIPSYKAALEGGFFGLGYGVSHPDIMVPGTGSHFDNNGRYIREKGNSFLALIEETGMIGFVLFLLPLLYVLKKQISEARINKNLNPAFYILNSAFIAFLLHSQFEAWMVGVGSVQLPLFFFYTGCMIFQK